MAINLNNPYGMVGIQPNIGTITPPPTPAPTIPGFTGFGDRLATIGGFGDDPDELKTQEELAKMTQAQIDQYTKQRKGARRSGVSEALIQFGEALQGKPATENALKRKQALQNMEMQKQYQAEYQAAIQAAEQTNPAQARLLRSLGLPGFVELQQKRAEQMFLGGAGESTSLMQNAQYLSGLRQRYNKMTTQQKESKEGELLLQNINDVVGLGGAGKYDPTLAFKKKSAETAGVQGREFADGPLTKGEVSTDEKFGTFYVNYTKEGRGAKNIGNLENLQDAQDIMEIAAKNGIPISSVPAGLIANRPSLSAFLNPQGVMSQERVANVIQQSLKEILGGQFAQKEGEALILRGYNPSLPVEENLERLLNLKSQVQQIIESEQDSINYYENNKKSLSGYKGKKYTTEDFSRDLSKDYTMDVIGMSDADIENAYMNIPISGSESLWEKTLEKEIKRRADKNR